MTTFLLFVVGAIVLVTVGLAAERWRRKAQGTVSTETHEHALLAEALATAARRRHTSEMRAHNLEMEHDPTVARCSECDTALSRAASVDDEPRYMPRCPGCGRDVTVRHENGLPIVTAKPHA